LHYHNHLQPPGRGTELEHIGKMLVISNGDPNEALLASIDCWPCRENAAEIIDQQKYREAKDAHLRN
jgi:hypothetical protein